MTKASRPRHFTIIMITYLLGIFMGAIDTGIVTPARTVIQNSMQVSDTLGIWMITIYTLAYAASIPIMGKLADKWGRKYIYLVSILLFGTGSLLCGLSHSTGSFTFLLIARAIQAIGGGGILPVATAEFGTTFPPEKRGMALGLVGGVYGIANIFGASAGSAILDLFGTNNWQYIFYINVPITAFIIIAGILYLPNTKESNVKKIDFGGILVLTVMVLSLMYGLKNIDYFNFTATIASTSVYPFLLIFLVMMPLFLLAEKKAQDPVLNLSYFKNSRILITLALSFITGVVMMGMIFVPQFSENAMMIASGSGGYFVIVLGVFAGIGAPLSGKLIDRFGVKPVLGTGFLFSILGSLYLILITANNPNLINVLVCLILTGVGIGFTMGTPLNYMMLENTPANESNSALATVSLVRSIGTAIAPAIMIGFLAHAGLSVQTNIMNLLPKEVTIPPLPYAQELTDEFNKLKSDPNTSAQFASIDMPDLTSMQTIQIDMTSDSGYEVPDELLDLMKSSDVTTIVENTKTFASSIFAEMSPDLIANIQFGVQSGIDAMNSAAQDLTDNIDQMQQAYDGIGAGINGMSSAVSAQQTALAQLQSLQQMLVAIPGSATSTDIISLIPPYVLSNIPQSALSQLDGIKTMQDLDNAIQQLQGGIAGLNAQIAENKQSQSDLMSGIGAMKNARSEMNSDVEKMTVLRDAVPAAFEAAESNYLAQIDAEADLIRAEFQKTLNIGFKQVYLTAAIASALALLILAAYRKKTAGSSE